MSVDEVRWEFFGYLSVELYDRFLAGKSRRGLVSVALIASIVPVGSLCLPVFSQQEFAPSSTRHETRGFHFYPLGSLALASQQFAL